MSLQSESSESSAAKPDHGESMPITGQDHNRSYHDSSSEDSESNSSGPSRTIHYRERPLNGDSYRDGGAELSDSIDGTSRPDDYHNADHQYHPEFGLEGAADEYSTDE